MADVMSAAPARDERALLSDGLFAASFLRCEICGFTSAEGGLPNWHMKKHDAGRLLPVALLQHLRQEV